MAVAAATTLAVTLPLSGTASADPTPPVPTRAKVDQARAEVADRRAHVKEIEAQLAAANARLEQASLEASIAAEAYNGAVWKLSEARKAYSVAQAREKQAKADVAAQRDAIVALVTESYQNGTELNTATAMLSDEGPAGLMNRYAVVESAGDSMEAHYDAYRRASARAEVATARALRARKHQATLAAEARKLRDEASAAANYAAVAAGQIAVQREQLIRALARAQNISVELAGRRQAALEKIAREKAAAAARAREAARAEALAKAAREAKRKAKQAEKDHKKAENSGDGIDLTGGDAGPPVSGDPPAPGTGARRAIAYAKAQLGKPYQWGADGPGSFDCSGLTMMAWRAGGKSLPHWSVAQFQQSTRISVGQLRPGDLVFWGSSPGSIHHVAMYIGNGQIIHAPRTGQPVQINSMYYWVPPDYYARP
jgi:cell wall-associated NlpC family hydrolase